MSRARIPSFSSPVSHMVRLAVLGVVLGLSSPAAARQPVRALVQRLESGVDFRVRVQAALELGKSKSRAARRPLEAALDDDNAAVRAAAAAALKVLGDPESLRSLRRHLKDPSAAVRSQIASTIAALEAIKKKAEEEPEVLVQMGKVSIGGRKRSRSVEAVAERTSRKKLDELPGVELVDEKKPKRRAKKKEKKGDLPLVMVTGRVKRLDRSRRGRNVTYSASIEFVMHRMPGRSISSVVTGSASASSDADDGDREALDDLRRSALEAAIESALRNAPEALEAASR